jgi:GTP-binding protein EngB required for normal cell division
MPARTPFPPRHTGEQRFWQTLLELDDGALHFWHSVTPSNGTEVDVLLFDVATGAYCLEIKAIGFDSIRHLDVQTLERGDGAVGPSPFTQALHASRALGGILDRHWEGRPFLVPIAAFPKISKEQWNARFQEGPLAGGPCLLAEDLTDLHTLRKRLLELATHPIVGRARKVETCGLQDQDPDRLHTILFGSSFQEASTAMVAVAENSNNAIPMLLKDVIELTKGPAAHLGSPGLEGLLKWSTALDDESTRLRVSVVGDFKAGKSTLINALLQREVCFVDDFEATSIRALYRDGVPERADLSMESGEITSTSIADFVQRCAKRTTQGIRFATITLPTGLPFDIADSPGLGASTSGHRSQAEEEIRRTDLLVLAIDCSDAGGAGESSLIARAKEVGLPVIVLLTKADILGSGEGQLLIDYVAGETGIDPADVIPVSARRHLAGQDTGFKELLDRLVIASNAHIKHRSAARVAKHREIVDACVAVLQRLLELNVPHARFVNAERGYLESSAADIAQAARSEWLSVLRQECARVVSSSEVQFANTPLDAESAIRAELPSAIDRACASFMVRLSVLVRDEWKNALQERSNEFEKRIAQMLRNRPDAEADLAFLKQEQTAFQHRAHVVVNETEGLAGDQRLWVTGLGAVASVITASFLPLALGAVAAAFFMRDQHSPTSVAVGLDPGLNRRVEDHLLAAFERITPDIEQAIDRIVGEVAIRSLDKLVRDRGGPDLNTILLLERRSNDLLEELEACRP